MRTIKNFGTIVVTALIILTTVSCKNPTDTPKSTGYDPLLSPVTPTASPLAGRYAAAQSVTLTTTAGAAIYYTLNGSIPTASSDQYTVPIIISHSTTIKAVAIKDGFKSEILTAVYSIPLYTELVRRVTFNGDTATVNIDYLYGDDIYLVKVNTSEFIVDAADTGNARVLSPLLSPGIQGDELLYATEKELPRMGHPAADEFNANPPPIVAEGPRKSRTVFVPPVVGDKRMFWVERYFQSGDFVQKQATLRATGQYGNIWIMDENYGSGGGKKITAAQAQTLAAKFDLIYPIETNLLGFEYGGGPDGDGGKDEDPKIQILVYSIVNNSGVAQAAGFFWAKDFYSSISGSNLAEIFYLDASQINVSINYMYSTLVHEFQHMINFNVKFVKHEKYSATWYDEMLAMMTQDVIDPLIGIEPANSVHEINQEIPTFLGSYNQIGITEWNDLERASYAKGYAFGAYLMRNYGGPELLKKLLANDKTNIESITLALNEISGGLNFQQVLNRYGEAMIFSGSSMPGGVATFDKTVTCNVNGISYTAYGFDIWNIKRYSQNIYGPVISDLTPIKMRQHSITVHSADEWKNRTGSISITLDKPNNPNIELYLMVRQDTDK